MQKRKDWDVIQLYCNSSKTWKSVMDQFNISSSTLHAAVKSGRLIFSPLHANIKSNNRYDWDKIQYDMTNGMSYSEISRKYGCSDSAILDAKRRGQITTLSRSQAMIICNKKYPRKHSQETKDKISLIRKEYLRKHPDKVPYLLNHHSNGYSYPEKYFIILFKKEGINLTKKYRVGLYQLDFADINKKLDIEIDGDQHIYDKRIVKHDIERTNNLKKKGWKTYRILWSDYQKKNFEEKVEVINNLKEFLNQ